MSDLDPWKLCNVFTIIQAALLIVGKDPSYDQHYIEKWWPNERPEGYEAAKAALLNSIMSNKLPANMHMDAESNTLNLQTTTISLNDIKTWLHDNETSSEFFEESGQPGYLNPEHERYAPKLAAAVNAWLAMQEGELIT